MLWICLLKKNNFDLYQQANLDKPISGGYLIGQISLVNAPQRCYIEVTLAPGDESGGVSIVPNLLHVTWKTGRRDQGGEEPAEAHEWRLVLERDGNKIYR